MPKKIPEPSTEIKELPEVTEINKELPEVTDVVKDNPIVGDPNNTVFVDGIPFEIKPTKLKYHRDRTALFYHVLEKLPLPDILAADVGYFDDERDGDKCLFDFLIAIFDDEEFVKAHYNDMGSDTILKALEIFKRINGITEKEEQSKNRATKETKA